MHCNVDNAYVKGRISDQRLPNIALTVEVKRDNKKDGPRIAWIKTNLARINNVKLSQCYTISTTQDREI